MVSRTLLIAFCCLLCCESKAQEVIHRSKKIYDDSWGLVVGIDDYMHWPNLRYAVADAKAIKTMLVDTFKFNSDNVLELYDSDATLLGIRQALSRIIRLAGRSDRVVVFFAGHGHTVKTDEGGEMGYLIPSDGLTDDPSLYFSALPMSDIKNLNLSIRAKHVLFILDACFSGLVGMTSVRGNRKEASDYLEKVLSSRARQIITAGGKDEFSHEGAEWNHSAFTYHLLNGMGRYESDRNDDGIITARELALYLEPKVIESTNKEQKPQFFSVPGDEGEVVFLVGEKERLGTALVAESKVLLVDGAVFLMPFAGIELDRGLAGTIGATGGFGGLHIGTSISFGRENTSSSVSAIDYDSSSTFYGLGIKTTRIQATGYGFALEFGIPSGAPLFLWVSAGFRIEDRVENIENDESIRRVATDEVVARNTDSRSSSQTVWQVKFSAGFSFEVVSDVLAMAGIGVRSKNAFYVLRVGLRI